MSPLLRFLWFRNGRLSVKSGCTFLEDDPGKGQQKTVTIDENIGKVHNMILDEERLRMR